MDFFLPKFKICFMFLKPQIALSFLPLNSSFNFRRFTVNSSQHSYQLDLASLQASLNDIMNTLARYSGRNFFFSFVCQFLVNCCSDCSSAFFSQCQKTQIWHVEENSCTKNLLHASSCLKRYTLTGKPAFPLICRKPTPKPQH